MIVKELIEKQLKEVDALIADLEENLKAGINDCELRYKTSRDDLQCKQEILKMALSVAV